jgi:ankyrin repeat protein
MANVFVHFEPIGPVGEEIKIDPDLPQYVIRGSEEEQNWRAQNRNGYKIMDSSHTTGSTLLHQAAMGGDAKLVRKLLGEKAHLVNARDINGWMPLHVSLFLRETGSVVLFYCTAGCGC